jgi:hypothetical protein
LLDLPLRDLVDAAFALLIEWSSHPPKEIERLDAIFRYFRDKETEYETGEPVLPGWASIGNVAAHFGDDGADPFASDPTPPPTDDPST